MFVVVVVDRTLVLLTFNLFFEMNEDGIQTMVSRNEIIFNLSLPPPLSLSPSSISEIPEKKAYFDNDLFIHFQYIVRAWMYLDEGMLYMC